MSETNIENSPEYKQVKQRIKQANIDMMQATKFDQGMHGYDGSIDLGSSKRKHQSSSMACLPSC